MNKDDIFVRVQNTLCSTLKVPTDRVQLATRLAEDLDADSLFIAQFGIALEDEFDIMVDDTAMPGLVTVEDIVDFVAREVEKA